MKDSVFGKAASLVAVVAGNFLYAFTVKAFLMPAELVTGGTTGMALTVEHLFDIPVSGFVLAFNVAMLLLGWRILGRGFAVTTLGSTFLYPLALEVWERVLGDLVLTQDILLCTVFTGLGIGLSLGIVIRSGASTGGMDIPPLVLRKFFRIPVSVSMYAFDVVILLTQALFRPVENVLYGILLVLIYTVVLDRMLLMGQGRTEVKIVSGNAREIADAIMHQVDRGVTYLDGRGGYLGTDTEVVLSVISNRELAKVEKLVHGIDPTCFMVVSRVSEVRGRGFSLSKKYE